MSAPPGDEAGRRPGNPEATPVSTSPGPFLNVPAVVGRPTLVELCDFIKRDTVRILLQADEIDATAAFCEGTWLDGVRDAIRRARDLATLERMWAA